MNQEHGKLQPYQTLLVGFNGKTTHTVGQLMLEVTIGEVRINTLFLIDNSVFPYNEILGHPWIHATIVVTSTYHQKSK